MKIIKNEKLIRRNGKIGQWTSLGALPVLGIGMFISLRRPELFIWAVAALLTGFILTQAGMYYGNRWGRSPRPDEKLDAGLKGLPGEFTFFHYATPASHLLVGPAGVWVLMPYHQRGKILFQKNRWQVKGGGFLQGYMRIFGQESLGRPDVETRTEIETLSRAWAKEIDPGQMPAIRGALVFTADDVQIEAQDSPLPAMPLRKLKDFIRQQAREQPLGPLALQQLKAVLPEE